MIPKQLFFIWFGDKLKEDLNDRIKEFKQFNTDYNIELIYEKDPFKCNNNDILECLDLLNNKENYLYKIYNRDWAIKNLNTQIGKNVRFSDCFRFYILNKYGGIYLDCDTFPLKSFDDILNLKSFTCINLYNKTILDIFFMGNSKNNHLEFPKDFVNKNTINIIDSNIYIKHDKKYSWKL